MYKKEKKGLLGLLETERHRRWRWGGGTDPPGGGGGVGGAQTHVGSGGGVSALWLSNEGED